MTMQTMTFETAQSERSAGKFWVVGGRYQDTDFRVVIPGTETVIGPFASREKALEVWRRLSEGERSDCLARFAIAAE